MDEFYKHSPPSNQNKHNPEIQMSRNNSARKTTSSDSEDQQDYSKMTTASLKKLSEARKIEGRSKLTTKDAMIGALEKFDNKDSEEEDEGKKDSENEEPSQLEYNKMNSAALKKLLEARGIEGRSRLTTKDAMIKVLEIFDQDPEDKTAISSLVAEVSTLKKSSGGKKSSKSSSKSETSSAEESSEDKPKKKRVPRASKKDDSIEKKKSIVSVMTGDILRHMKFMSRETLENPVLKENWIRQLKEIKKQLGLFETTIPVDINDDE
jgi:hypothetical protein